VTLPLPLLDLVALAFLLGALPLASVAQLRVVDGMDMEMERVPAYLSSIATLVVLGAAAWFVGSRYSGARALGLASTPLGPVLSWTAVLVVSALAAVVVFRQVGVALGVGESPLLRALMPRTPGERGLFAVLSVTAGVAEEVAYRGYALTTLAVVTGSLWAAVVTSVVFGVLHAYQGWLGVMRTGTMGGLLAWGYLASGSLWAPVAAHVLLDLMLGIVLAERLMVPEPRTGVCSREGDPTASPKEHHGSGSGPSR